MPIYDNSQVVTNYGAPMDVGNPVRELARAKAIFSVRLNGANYEYKLNDNTPNKWIVLADQTNVVPLLSIRTIMVIKDTEDWATLEFDVCGYGKDWKPNLQYQTGIVIPFRTGVPYHVGLTKLWLSGSQSDFTQVHMWG